MTAHAVNPATYWLVVFPLILIFPTCLAFEGKIPLGHRNLTVVFLFSPLVYGLPRGGYTMHALAGKREAIIQTLLNFRFYN